MKFLLDSKLIYEKEKIKGEPNSLSRQHEKGMWKKIYMGRDKFHECIRWRVVSGDRINFWKDLGLERERSEISFPIFSLLHGTRIFQVMNH